jgi:orotate phosphoribosyltransferase
MTISADALDVVRTRLRDIVAAKSLLAGRRFTAASGKPNIFFDMKKTMLDPEGANLIADLMLDVLSREDVDHVGGVAMEAVPLVSSLCVKSYHRRLRFRYFYVRKEAKDHGTATLVDGDLERGAKVAILEDVTTTGGSALKAAAAVKALGGQVKLVLSIVDRGEGADVAFRAHGLRLIPLLRWTDFAT